MTTADREAAQTLHAIAGFADLPAGRVLLAVRVRPSPSAGHVGWYDLVVDGLSPERVHVTYADPVCFALLGNTPDAAGWLTAWVWVDVTGFGEYRGLPYVKISNDRDHAAAEVWTNPPRINAGVREDAVMGFRRPGNTKDRTHLIDGDTGLYFID